MAQIPTSRTYRSLFAGLLLLAGLAGCGDGPLPLEPDPCAADLTLMAGHWTGMAGDVRVTMQLSPTRVYRFLIFATALVDAMSGPGVADHPEDTLDVTFAVEFWCWDGLSSPLIVNPPPESDAPVQSPYPVASLSVVSVGATQLVADLKPSPTPSALPNPFGRNLRIVFERPSA